MIFIDNLGSVLIFINFFSYAMAGDCTTITDFLVNQDLFVFNSEESLVFLPSEYFHENATSKLSTLVNTIDYKEGTFNTLSATNFKISDQDLTNAVRQSLNSYEIFNDVISVFPNRFVVKVDITVNYLYSFKFKDDISADVQNGCDLDEIQYWRTVIKGILCKKSFITGVRYNINCESITFYFLRIEEDGKLDAKIICKK